MGADIVCSLRLDCAMSWDEYFTLQFPLFIRVRLNTVELGQLSEMGCQYFMTKGDRRFHPVKPY